MANVVETLPDLDAIAQRGLELFESQAEEAIRQRGKFTVALAGGSTPKILYQKLAQRSLPLDSIHLFWGDERYVPPDHAESNQRMVREAWLNQVSFPAENVHPMPTGSADPQKDAETYAMELQHFWSLPLSEFPVFDLVLLGIGDDGHTASLFPHTAALKVCDRWVTNGVKDGQPRITLTIPILNQARCVVFMVAGVSKAPALTQIFAPESDALQYPARFIRPTQGTCYWLLEAALSAAIP